MDLEYLKSNAGRFAYELRKNFPEEERPVKHFVCDQEVVVLSNRKLYIFYVGIIIYYKFGKLIDIDIVENDGVIELTLMKKEFKLKFQSKDEYDLFINYFKKYKY